MDTTCTAGRAIGLLCATLLCAAPMPALAQTAQIDGSAPTFQMSAPKYAWLNGVQAVAKMVEVKARDGGYVKYDVFVVR